MFVSSRVIESLGPSNTRKYVVAVYFRGERLATGTGHSIQQAEMSAANNALEIRSGDLFRNGNGQECLRISSQKQNLKLQ